MRQLCTLASIQGCETRADKLMRRNFFLDLASERKKGAVLGKVQSSSWAYKRG